MNLKTTLQQNRLRRSQRAAQRQVQQDTRQTHLVTYAGSANGIHRGRLPNGALMPIRLISSGSAESGQVVSVSVARGSSTGYGRIMPR